MYPASIAIAIRNGRLLDEAQAAIRELPLRVAGECGEPEKWEDFMARMEQESPAVLLIETDLIPGDFTAVLSAFRRRVPHARIIAVHATADPQIILSAMRAGVSEFLYPPLAETLPAALQRMSGSLHAIPGPPKRGKLFGFVSAKGGCGATTVVCHLAGEVQRLSAKDTLLADLDINGGIVSFVMKVTGRYSIFDAASNLPRLDGDMWKSMTVTAKNGLKILPEAPRLTGESLDLRNLQRVLRFLRTQHDFVFIDLGNGISPLVVAVMEELDTLFLISTLDVPALHSVKMAVRALKLSSADIRKVNLILNRMPKTSDVSPQEIEKILERQLYATFSDEHTAVYNAYVNGTLVPSGCRLARQFASAAARLCGHEETQTRKRFALFG